MSTRANIDSEILSSNCAGDRRMMRELIAMAIESMSRALLELDAGMLERDWGRIGRTVHKLRPVLAYCGVATIADELLRAETDAREQTNLAELETRMPGLIRVLRDIGVELEEYSATLPRG